MMLPPVAPRAPTTRMRGFVVILVLNCVGGCGCRLYLARGGIYTFIDSYSCAGIGTTQLAE